MFSALKIANKIAIKSNKKAYVGLIILSLMMCANVYVGLSFTEYTINSAYHLFNKSTDIRTVIIGILVFTAAIVVFNILNIGKQLINNKLMLDITYNFNKGLNNKLGNIKWDYYEDHNTFIKIHEVKNNTLNTIKNMVNSIIAYITVLPLALIYGYYLAQINIFVVLIYIGLVIVFNLFIAGKMFSQLGGYWKEIQDYNQKETYFFNFSGDKVTHQEYKFNRLFNYASSLWEKHFLKEYKVKLKIFKKHEITLQLARIIFNIPYISMMVFIAFEVSAGIHEIGFLIMANSLLNKIINTCLNIQNNITSNSVESVFVKTYQEVMDLEDYKCLDSIEPLKTDIVLKDITFKYPQSKVNSLENLDLNIKQGEKIAIVGYNGSGKTTFTNILMSLTNNYEGTVSDENGKTIVNLKDSISCIIQDFAQYQMTIKENIAAGYQEHNFTDEEIISLLEKVGLKDKVLAYENGINTTLGQLEKGVELSKGQWQRLAIARLLANPNATIWILDEPTAYLDPISEIEIYDMIYKFAEDKTVLFISHRLGFAKKADRIIVFENGKVTEQGNHNDLLKKNGIYSEMYQAQESWYTAS